MSKFTELETDRLLKGFEFAMQELAEEHGISFKRGRAQYGEDVKFSMTFNKVEETEHGEFPSTIESREFTSRCKSFRLMPDILFQEFNSHEGRIRIMGYSTRKRKYPIVYTKNGRNFKCSIDFMVDLVGKSVQEYML